MSAPGTFVISLDFELRWGVRDQVEPAAFAATAAGARRAVLRMLELFEVYRIHATWATVGLLFFRSRDELLQGLPERKPQYAAARLSPYGALANLGRDEADDPLHFAASLVEAIRRQPHQEVATHTFSHFYCLEPGQTVEDFRQDLAAARDIACRQGIDLRSIVFPRNQVSRDYVQMLRELQIVAYRGNRQQVPATATAPGAPSLLTRGLRLLDSYVNLTGANAYALEQLRDGPPYNIPASRFLRPHATADRLLAPLKRKRICDALTIAAQRRLLYHLWWHPHNFGRHLEENLDFLESILKHYSQLRRNYGMRSCTMLEVAALLAPH